MSLTSIPASRLVELRADGARAARSTKFVDPDVISHCTKVLDRRGERWAGAILGRNIDRRSIAVPSRPYLFSADPYVLVAADHEEDIAILAAHENDWHTPPLHEQKP